VDVSVSGRTVVDRGMAAVELGAFPEVAASADAETGDQDFRAGTRAFRTDAGFGIVFRAGELFKPMVALAASIIEERHPVLSLVLLLKARKLRV
jgi:hypothetical protein